MAHALAHAYFYIYLFMEVSYTQVARKTVSLFPSETSLENVFSSVRPLCKAHRPEKLMFQNMTQAAVSWLRQHVQQQVQQQVQRKRQQHEEEEGRTNQAAPVDQCVSSRCNVDVFLAVSLLPPSKSQR